MSSHLSVSVTPPAPAPAPGLASASPTKSDGPLGVFGGMLDAIATATGFSRKPASASNADAQPAPGSKSATARQSITVPLAATATASDAVPTDAAAPPDGTPPKLIRDLVAALAAIEQAKQNGEPVDPDLLKQAKTAIDALAAFIATTQPGAADATAAAAPGGGDTKVDAAAAHNLDAARATLGEFTAKLDALAKTLGDAQPDLAAKLETLVKQLDPKALPPATLAQLGLDPKAAAADPALAAAINGFVNGKAAARPDAQPSLATPSLKLPADSALTTGTDKDKGGGATGLVLTSADKPAPPPATPQPAAAAASTAPPAKPDDAAKPDAAKAAATAAAATATTDKPAPAAPPGAVPGAIATTPAPPLGAPLLQAQSAYLAAAAPINLPQMAFEIVRHTQLGANHFQIRLDPADMGRVDVRLAIDSGGTINAHLTVDRPETLDLLKRDAATLSQALAQAGLDAGKTNLQFSLNQNPFARQGTGGGPDNASAPADDAGSRRDTGAITPLSRYRGTATPGGLNLFV